MRPATVLLQGFDRTVRTCRAYANTRLAAPMPSSTASSSERGERQSPASSTRSPAAASCGASSSTGTRPSASTSASAPERPPRAPGAKTLRKQHAAGRRAGQLEVLPDLHSRAIEPLQGEVAPVLVHALADRDRATHSVTRAPGRGERLGRVEARAGRRPSRRRRRARHRLGPASASQACTTGMPCALDRGAVRPCACGDDDRVGRERCHRLHCRLDAERRSIARAWPCDSRADRAAISAPPVYASGEPELTADPLCSARARSTSCPALTASAAAASPAGPRPTTTRRRRVVATAVAGHARSRPVRGVIAHRIASPAW